MEKPITAFTSIELQALAYTVLKEMKNSQNTLQVIETELASRAQKAQEKKKMEEITNDVVVEEVVETTEEATETAE